MRPAKVSLAAGRVRIRPWTVNVASRGLATPGCRLPCGLLRPGPGRVAGQGPLELRTGADTELGEHFVQVVLHRAGADEQPAADLRVRRRVAERMLGH